jgi:hypothetical protein
MSLWFFDIKQGRKEKRRKYRNKDDKITNCLKA